MPTLRFTPKINFVIADGGFPASPAPSTFTSGADIKLAGWWRRVGATVVDGLVTGAIATVLATSIDGTNGARVGSTEIVVLIYTVLLLGSVGRTIGTWSVGTRVVRTNGVRRVGYLRAFLRWFVQQVLTATVIGGFPDVLWPLWDSRKQTLHDKAADTLVIVN